MPKVRVEAKDACFYMGEGLGALRERALREIERLLRGGPADLLAGPVEVVLTDGQRVGLLQVLAVPVGTQFVALLGQSPQASVRTDGLTPRERDVFELAHQGGLTNAEVARRCKLSISTVRHHLRNAYAKLGQVRRPRRFPRTPALLALTAREGVVAEHAARGETNAEIARALGLSPVTIGTCLSRIYRKVGVRNRSGLAAMIARGQGWPDSSRVGGSAAR